MYRLSPQESDGKRETEREETAPQWWSPSTGLGRKERTLYSSARRLCEYYTCSTQCTDSVLSNRGPAVFMTLSVSFRLRIRVQLKVWPNSLEWSQSRMLLVDSSLEPRLSRRSSGAHCALRTKLKLMSHQPTKNKKTANLQQVFCCWIIQIFQLFSEQPEPRTEFAECRVCVHCVCRANVTMCYNRQLPGICQGRRLPSTVR